MTRLITGHDSARRLLDTTAGEAGAFQADTGRAPCLALLTLGAPAPALAYAARIRDFAQTAGVEVRPVEGPADASRDQVLALIDDLNADDGIDGILPLSPFPPGVALAHIAARLSPDKDVDGLTTRNVGRLASGLDGLFPCTPQGAVLLAETIMGDLRGRAVTVVGASANVGRPLALLLLQRGVTVTVAHIDTRDLAAACRTADLLFVAAGKAGLIDARHVAPGAVVIDIGINAVDDGKGGRSIVGDVDLAAVQGIASAISAVPDGVGPITTAYVLVNTIAAARQRLAVDKPGALLERIS